MGGTTYVGVATSTTADLGALTSVYDIRLRPGDSGPNWHHAARGDISRSMFIDKFLAGDWDNLLFLDGDMRFPPDLLERLRAHDLPFVAGLYFRRQLDPMWPLAFEYERPLALPFTPLYDYPKRGLVRVNASGCGCWLVKREVFADIQAEMKRTIKERLGLDLARVPFMMDGPMPEVRDDYQRIGADLRFCYYAQRAGYDIWLDCDPELDIGHFAHIPLTRKDYEAQRYNPKTLESIAGLYAASAQHYREENMDEKAAQLQLQRFYAQREQAQREAQKLLGVMKQAREAGQKVQRQLDQIGGAIVALEEILGVEPEAEQE